MNHTNAYTRMLAILEHPMIVALRTLAPRRSALVRLGSSSANLNQSSKIKRVTGGMNEANRRMQRLGVDYFTYASAQPHARARAPATLTRPIAVVRDMCILFICILFENAIPFKN
jgi:hypothetical protein